MDAAKLRNSCVCGNSEPYALCCGPYSEAAPATGETSPFRGESSLLYDFRHALHGLHMHLFPLRMLYQQYWEKLGLDDYPHHALMEDGDYGRGVVENFFWDYSVQYSDARPILRTAREIEGRDLRMGHDLLQWSFAPLWPFFVVESTETEAHLRQVGQGKMHRIRHDGRMPPAGHGIWLRLLPFRGEEFAGMARLATPQPVDPGHFEALAASIFRDMAVRPSVALRPDVHCEEWRRHGSLFLAQWRQMVYDAEVGKPDHSLTSAPVIELPAPANPGWASELKQHAMIKVLGDGRFELRHRALSLARLEIREGKNLLSLFDPVFAPAVGRFLAPLGFNLGRALGADPGDMQGEAGASLDAWLHVPHPYLGGQTPIQASTHDFGRRRLKSLVKDMTQQGSDMSSLLKQLDL